MSHWRVLLLDTKRSNPNHYICLAIERALRQHPQVAHVVKADYLSAIEEARKGQCNLLLAFDGEELDRNIVARLAALCGTSVAWVTEDPYEQRTNVGNLDLFDLVFTNDSGSVAAYGAKGRHLPFAADPQLHYREVPSPEGGDSHYLYDLFFAGTAWPNRVAFLKELQGALSGINLKLALPHNPHIPEPDLDLAPSAYQWRTPNSEFARFANRSRAVLTLHRAFSSSGNDPVARTPGPRLFEVALAGGVQFIDMSIPEIEVTRYLTEDVEFIGFRSAQECIEKLRFFLANPAARIAVAQAAQRRAQSEHLYIHRIEALLAETAALPARAARGMAEAADTRRRPKVLFVTHNIAGIEPYGGVEVYQDLIRQSLKDRYEFLFYVPDRSTSHLGSRCVLYDENLRYLEDHEFSNNVTDADLVCADRERALSSILQRHGIDAVHFQHLIGHTPSLAYLPRALGIPSVLSLHDYYGICTHFNLIGYKGRYCNIAALPKSTCDICLNAADGIAAGSQARRRAFIGRALEQIDVLHANTAGVAALFGAIYPHLTGSARMRVFGVPMPGGTRRELPTRQVDAGGKLKVAILGNFTRNKGADELIHAFNQMRHEPVEFTIFGALEPPYGSILEALALPNVKIHGAYAAGTLAEKLDGFSLSLHFSLWPETYCITLSEAWQAGLVPVVSDIGALGERVSHGVNGFKVPNAEAGALVELLRTLAYDRAQIEEARARITPDLYVEAGAHMQWLSGVYEELLAAKPLPRRAAVRPQPVPGESLADFGVIVNHRTWSRGNSGPMLATGGTGALTVVSTSLLGKTMAYVRQHGVLATARRILQELPGARRAGGRA
jgi:glycosyltransferase involved in cell wall biosynthesis/spore maturation protein CgeB